MIWQPTVVLLQRDDNLFLIELASYLISQIPSRLSMSFIFLPVIHTSHIPAYSVRNSEKWERVMGKKSRNGSLHLTLHKQMLQMALWSSLSLIHVTAESFLFSTSLLSYPQFLAVNLVFQPSFLSLYPAAWKNRILNSSMSSQMQWPSNHNCLIPLKMEKKLGNFRGCGT